jgi:hypothetical protein
MHSRPQSTRLANIELMHMLREQQLQGGAEDGFTPAEQFYVLASSSRHPQGRLTSNHPHPNIYDIYGPALNVKVQ